MKNLVLEGAEKEKKTSKVVQKRSFFQQQKVQPMMLLELAGYVTS